MREKCVASGEKGPRAFFCPRPDVPAIVLIPNPRTCRSCRPPGSASTTSAVAQGKRQRAGGRAGRIFSPKPQFSLFQTRSSFFAGILIPHRNENINAAITPGIFHSLQFFLGGVHYLQGFLSCHNRSVFPMFFFVKFLRVPVRAKLFGDTFFQSHFYCHFRRYIITNNYAFWPD